MALVINNENGRLQPRRRVLARDLIGIAVMTAIAAIGYVAFPDNLALLTRMITIALLVLSLDLVTGYCGVATLGHAALFGSGAYAAGILSAHYGINDPLLMMLAGIAGGAIAGLLSGAIILRAHGLPQLVLSIALINLFHEFANKASSWTGGSDGLSGIAPDPIFGIFEFDLYGQTAFFFGMALLLIVFVLLRFLVRSPFGMLCRGIKQDPLRIRAMGASPKAALIRMYVISGAVAGVGGALNGDLDAGRRPRQPVFHPIGRSACYARARRYRLSLRCALRHGHLHALRGLRLGRQSLPLADHGRCAADRRRAFRAERSLRDRRELYRPPQRAALMSPVFEVANLKKAFGGLAVTNDVSLAMSPGDRVALIGPNGAGKTTFVNLVTGNLSPDSGEVWLGGEVVTKVGAIGRVKRGLVRSFQVTRLFQDMTPAEHVGLAILQRDGRSGRMFGNFLHMPEVMAEVDDLLGKLGLTPLMHRKVSEIAYGQQRLLEIAVALALKPKVLLLDEPAAGVPQSDTGRIEQALADLPADLAVLMIEHDMDLVFRFARRVIVLAAGAIIFDGRPEDVTKDARVREAYLGSYANAGPVA
ncbi:ABC-type branched-chain amino acid transport system, ATPase component [Rhizobium leguminosarum bv. trifolii WSM597]|uniref:ABC-type branched-chain amino acid transport system, ATPase component n=2 Tax=Rhizobium leguminosarum TaxID=384 RepID=J0H6B4_RHILT|nr:ABC-type branched-chain amino acid transport system, ATPase component [Rhizobium leguminosarum bv. trifolii WSM597]